MSAVAALTLASPVTAAETRADNAALSTVGEDDLRDLVLAMGHNEDVGHPLDAPSVRGMASDGLRYLLIAIDCPRDSLAGCKGEVIQVRYSANEKVTLSGLAAANLNETAVTNWWDAERKVVGFTRYVHLEGGATWANLKSDLSLLLKAQPTAQAMLAANPSFKATRAANFQVWIRLSDATFSCLIPPLRCRLEAVPDAFHCSLKNRVKSIDWI